MTPRERDPPRVLVVDDNATNRRILHRMVEASGAIAHSVSGGVAAVEHVADSPTHIVLMDLHMPDMSGIDAACKMRARTDHSPIRIIAVTANVSSKAKRMCTEAGFDGFIEKPVRRDAIAAVVAKT